ncbi:MAG: hypothetical protein U0L98_04705 [Clostridia bacterium]|nr:hypothetical protein [Clostridia bacterium]
MKENEILKDKEKKEKYVNNFSETFDIKDIKIDTTKLPLLTYIIHEIGEDLYIMSDETREICKKKNKLFEELEKCLTEEQKQILEEYLELENQMNGEIEEQLFMYGFIMSQQLENERKETTKI